MHEFLINTAHFFGLMALISCGSFSLVIGAAYALKVIGGINVNVSGNTKVKIEDRQ